MLFQCLILCLLGVNAALAGICQDVFKSAKEPVQPFFKIFEGQAVEIYYPKRSGSQEMFGIKVYKNQDLRKKDLRCDLCANTTHVEDGCFKIKSNLLKVDIRDVLKFVVLTKATGANVAVTESRKLELTDYVIPSQCVCRGSADEYCPKASSKISDHRPLFRFHESAGFSAYLPKAASIATIGLEALKNGNFRPGGKQQSFDINVDTFTEHGSCLWYTSNAENSRFALGDYINFVVIGRKTGGEKIRTEPRKVFLNAFFIPQVCTCPQINEPNSIPSKKPK